MLSTFYGYFYSIAIYLDNQLKKKFPIIYCITLYIYSEYLAIVRGDLTKNIAVIISLYILFYLDKNNFLLYTVLLLSVLFKEYLLKQLRIQKDYPILYNFLVDILSLIITIVIFYFLDLICINTIKSLLLKIWNGLLNMSNFSKGNVEGGGELVNKGKMPNPQKPSDPSVIKADEEKDNKYKRRVNKEFYEFKKANIEFNSVGEKMDLDTKISIKDMVDDYGQYLPDTDRKKLSTILSKKLPGFNLTKEDSVHQFWLNKRISNKAGWDNTKEIIDIFAKNSKIVQEKLGGKNSHKSYLFRKETEQFKNMWSAPNKLKESIIKRELEKARSFDKVLKEKNLSIKEIIDSSGN